MKLDKSGRKVSLNTTRVATPNDLKLSDRRGWRDRCVAGGKAAAEAAGVTAAPVRCSAWLGVALWVGSLAKGRTNGEMLPPVAVTCAGKQRATPEDQSWGM